MARQRRGLPKVQGDIDKPVLGQELGVPNLLPATTWQAWSPDIPKGVLGVGRDPLAPDLNELIFMLRRDGQAQAMLNLLTLPIRAAFAKSEWVLPDGKSEGPEVEFANQMWNLPPQAGGMVVPRSMFLRQTLLAIPHGFSTFEIVKDFREDGPLKGKYVIDKMAYRDPRTVTMLADNHGVFQGFRQRANLAARLVDEVIEKENAWYYAANEEHNPMYGVSYFEPAFQHYQMKRKMYYIGEIAAQLSAVPGRLGEIPFGASPRQVREFIAGLKDLHFSQSMIVPPNFKVTPFNSNTGFNFIEIIDHHNTQMAASILAKFLQQEDRQVLIDNGKADASADMFVQLLEAITFELSESWSTRLMPQFIDYNFGSGVYPVHRFAPLTDSNREAIYNLFNTMVGLQTLNSTPEFMRSLEIELNERFGFGIDYNKVADAEEQAAKEMAEQAAQEAAAQQQMQQAQLDAAKQQAKPQPAGGGPAKPGPNPTQSQGQNKQQQGKPSNAPTGAGGRPPTVAKPTKIAASSKQTEAMNTIALALQDLITEDDVPDNFYPEGLVIPEMVED